MPSIQHNGDKKPASIARPLSANQIALRLNRSPVCVYRAIKRLGISPAFVLDCGFKFYNAAVVVRIEKGMRRRNGTVPRNANGNGTPS